VEKLDRLESSLKSSSFSSTLTLTIKNLKMLYFCQIIFFLKIICAYDAHVCNVYVKFKIYEYLNMQSLYMVIKAFFLKIDNNLDNQETKISQFFPIIYI
jgi:hypothetical protein